MLKATLGRGCCVFFIVSLSPGTCRNGFHTQEQEGGHTVQT
jgi:hypothetical protein